MIVSINQPAYLPWLGYFHRIVASDLHIVLDHVQFEKNSFTNRNKVRTPTGWCWLTVPVKTSGRFHDLIINTLEVGNATDWRRKHWETLQQNYSKAASFVEHVPFFADVYQKDCDRLACIYQPVTDYLLRSFQIETPLVFSSQLNVDGAKDELILNLCREVGADTYLSGALGRDYLREELFQSAGIQVVYQDYHHPTYTQMYPGFEPFLSAIDLLFNYGRESRDVLINEQEIIIA